MGTYFKPLRRKVGVVMLLLACGFMAIWVRSLRSENHFSFFVSNHTLVQLINRKGAAAIRTVQSDLPVEETDSGVDRVVLMGWVSRSGKEKGDLAISVDAPARAIEGSPYHWIVNRYGVEVGGVTDKEFPLRVFIICLPHWSIVMPLAVISAWLLLSKHRNSRSKPGAES